MKRYLDKKAGDTVLEIVDLDDDSYDYNDEADISTI